MGLGELFDEENPPSKISCYSPFKGLPMNSVEKECQPKHETKMITSVETGGVGANLVI